MANVISRTAPSTTTISGSTAETELAATTLPTNLLTSARSARMDILARIVAGTTDASVTFRAHLGSTSNTVWSTTVTPTTGSTSHVNILTRLQASSTADQEHWATVSHTTNTALLVGQSTESHNQALPWQITAQLSAGKGLIEMNGESDGAGSVVGDIDPQTLDGGVAGEAAVLAHLNNAQGVAGTASGAGTVTGEIAAIGQPTEQFTVALVAGTVELVR